MPSHKLLISNHVVVIQLQYYKLTHKRGVKYYEKVKKAILEPRFGTGNNFFARDNNPQNDNNFKTIHRCSVIKPVYNFLLRFH